MSKHVGPRVSCAAVASSGYLRQSINATKQQSFLQHSAVQGLFELQGKFSILVKCHLPVEVIHYMCLNAN